jgi:hypothetical protein
VTIDGNPVSAAGLGLKRPVDPGQHTVKAEAPGYKPGEATFQVAESGVAEAKIKLEKSAEGEAGAAGPGDTGAGAGGDKAAVSTEKGGNKTLALVAFGIGGVGLIAGGITGLIALNKHSSLNDKCPGGKCPSTSKSDVDSYNTMGTISTAGFIVGGIGVAAGVVLWVTSPKEGAAGSTAGSFKTVKPKAVTWHPYVGLGGGGVSGQF